MCYRIFIPNLKKSDNGSLIWAKIMLKAPIIGKATRMNAAARFTRTVSTSTKKYFCSSGGRNNRCNFGQ